METVKVEHSQALILCMCRCKHVYSHPAEGTTSANHEEERRNAKPHFSSFLPCMRYIVLHYCAVVRLFVALRVWKFIPPQYT